jgi:thiosulfate/3-mercaptopyruvate sulfurtransferase
MAYELLISTDELAAHLNDPDWLVVDCRFVLSRPNEKAEAYPRAHIPGAIYAHLDQDLSSPVIPGKTGRHPLPTREEAARRFGHMGIGPQTQVVAYDDQGGALAAGRMWWMLRWLGHPAAAILDGGWQKWLEEDRPVGTGSEKRTPTNLPLRPPLEQSVEVGELEQLLANPGYRVIDVRAPERYSGAVEPIDPIPGHIPGAHNAPYLENLNAEGVFRSPEELRQHYQNILGGLQAGHAVFYCGSGVTSVLSLIALERAGLGQARLYAGSYSDWIAGGKRPIRTGSEP